MANQVSVGFQSDGSIVQGPNFFPNGNAYGGPQYATNASGVQPDAMGFSPLNFAPQNLSTEFFSTIHGSITTGLSVSYFTVSV